MWEWKQIDVDLSEWEISKVNNNEWYLFLLTDPMRSRIT